MNTFSLVFRGQYLLPQGTEAFNENSGDKKTELDLKKN